MNEQMNTGEPPTDAPPQMAGRTAEQANTEQREAYLRARSAAHAPRDVSSKKGLLYAYIGMALAIVILTIAVGFLAGPSAAILAFISGVIILLVGSLPIWLASGSYHQERQTGRRV